MYHIKTVEKEKEKILNTTRGRKRYIQKNRVKNYSKLLIRNNTGKKKVDWHHKGAEKIPVNPQFYTQ